MLGRKRRLQSLFHEKKMMEVCQKKHTKTRYILLVIFCGGSSEDLVRNLFLFFCNSPFYIFPFLQNKIGVKKEALNNIVGEMVELGFLCHF